MAYFTDYMVQRLCLFTDILLTFLADYERENPPDQNRLFHLYNGKHSGLVSYRIMARCKLYVYPLGNDKWIFINYVPFTAETEEDIIKKIEDQ